MHWRYKVIRLVNCLKTGKKTLLALGLEPTPMPPNLPGTIKYITVD